MKLTESKLASLKIFMSKDRWKGDTGERMNDITKTKEGLVKAGENFLLKLNGAKLAETLDDQRYLMYNIIIKSSSLSASFKLETLPPTSAAAKYHFYSVYHAVQQ